MAEYVVKRSLDLSTPNNNRYIVISTVTGEIVDDAQGYGYKSPQKAWAAFQWKLRNGNPTSAEKNIAITRWLDKHPSFVDTLNDVALDIGKGRGPDDRITPRIVQNLLNEMQLTVDFTPRDILKMWREYDG
jgi:hypothetical protein